MVVRWKNLLIAALVLVIVFIWLTRVPDDAVSGFSFPPSFSTEQYAGVYQLAWWAMLLITLIAVVKLWLRK